MNNKTIDTLLSIIETAIKSNPSQFSKNELRDYLRIAEMMEREDARWDNLINEIKNFLG